MEAGAEKSRSATVLDLQAWTYYNLYHTTSWRNLLSDLHVPHKQWALDRRFWCLFCLCLRVSVILPTCSLYPQQKRAYSALHPQAWTCIHRPCLWALTECSPWISEDRLLSEFLFAEHTSDSATKYNSFLNWTFTSPNTASDSSTNYPSFLTGL